MESLSNLKIQQILNAFPSPFFTTVDFLRLFPSKKNTLYDRLKRLKKNQVIKEMRRGSYLIIGKRYSDFEVANRLFSPSCVSLESALSFYGIIAGFPYQITSVTPKKTRSLEFDGKEFVFHHLNPAIFFGFEKKENFLIAEPEKSLLDYLYFSFKGLRNPDLSEFDFSEINKNKFQKYCRQYRNKMFISYLRSIKKLC
ncbi:hypothetical protein L6272_02810 [Microgenomates group bacterium]|nr:hypothetical protein [Microgenomates group bacterium]